MNNLAVYIHIPFCTVKCGYCDFNAYAGMDGLKSEYQAALLREIEGWSDVLRGRSVTSVSFGGGTPGEFPAAWIDGIIEAVDDPVTLRAEWMPEALEAFGGASVVAADEMARVRG